MVPAEYLQETASIKMSLPDTIAKPIRSSAGIVEVRPCMVGPLAKWHLIRMVYHVLILMKVVL
jgi:hypothetical protein